MSLELRSVSVARGNKDLLRDVDLTVRPGEVISLIGPNGAGKTSLLRLLSGEMNPDRGSIDLDSLPIGEIPPETLAGRRAVLPQRAVLDFPFRVAEVIEMGRIPHFTGQQTDRTIVREVVDALELRPLADRTYTTLSGGERQRVQIGRVLAQLWDRLDGGYLLFDEPTAPLDLAHQLGFLALVRRLAERGAASVLVMHDLNLATRCSDRIVLLAQGCCIASGMPQDVVTKVNVANAFGVDVDVVFVDDHPFVHVQRLIS